MLTILIAVLLVALPASASRAEQVTATLGREAAALVLEISLAPPAPASLIARVTLPSGTGVVSVSPEGAKIDRGGTEVKWLVKSPRPGSHRFTVATEKPVATSSVTAVVLYRTGQGTLVTVPAVVR